MTDVVKVRDQSIEVLPAQSTRSLAKGLVRLGLRTEFRIRGAEAEGDAQASKVEAIGNVGRTAMLVVGSVTQMEQQLSQMFPLAAGRLQAIGDVTAFAAAEVVADTQTKLRRA